MKNVMYLFSFLVVLMVGSVSMAQTGSNDILADLPKKYICPPCGADCHDIEYDSPGICPVCNMRLEEKSANYDAVNLKTVDICEKYAGNPNVLFLDVRTEAEFNGELGHIKNAKLIPINSLAMRLGELNAYMDKEIVVYCSHGVRSNRARKMLEERGFSKVVNMAGGLTNWDHGSEKGHKCYEALIVKNR